MEMRDSPDPSIPFLDTVEGEIAFFRSIMRARPIGLHRHFHVLSIRTVIHQDTGRYVTIDDIWEKLRGCYNIEALENLVRYIPHPSQNRPSSPNIFLTNVQLAAFFSFLFRMPKGLNLPVPHIPHRAPSTHPLRLIISPCTPTSAKSSPCRTMKR
jgi:Chromatin modification-related protein EAF7